AAGGRPHPRSHPPGARRAGAPGPPWVPAGRPPPRGGVSFRADLLDDRRVVVAGGGAAAVASHERLRALGARTDELTDQTLSDEAGAADWARQRAPLRALVFDAGAPFGAGGAETLGAVLEHAWRAARAVATGALIEAQSPGRLLFLAPRPDAGRHAPAARAGLENLAR